MDATVPPSVTITKMILDSLPISAPLLMGIIVQAIISLRSAAAARRDAIEAKLAALEAKKVAEQTAKAVDGQMTEFKTKMVETSELKVQVASLTALAAGKEEGAAKAKLETLQHDALVAARALPPQDEKIVNGAKEQPQVDRIEHTGIDTNVRVQKVETVLGDRVDMVEEKLDKKKDKT